VSAFTFAHLRRRQDQESEKNLNKDTAAQVARAQTTQPKVVFPPPRAVRRNHMERSNEDTTAKKKLTKKSGKGQRKNSAEEEDEKKQTLRTSTDVYHRIKWDEVRFPLSRAIYFLLKFNYN
jgi:hypothetical protein